MLLSDEVAPASRGGRWAGSSPRPPWLLRLARRRRARHRARRLAGGVRAERTAACGRSARAARRDRAVREPHPSAPGAGAAARRDRAQPRFPPAHRRLHRPLVGAARDVGLGACLPRRRLCAQRRSGERCGDLRRVALRPAPRRRRGVRFTMGRCPTAPAAVRCSWSLAAAGAIASFVIGWLVHALSAILVPLVLPMRSSRSAIRRC